MARVDLDWREVRDDKLPDLCIRCGVQTSQRLYKTFLWMPWWRPVVAVPMGVLLLPVGFIPFIGRLLYSDMLGRLTKPEEMEVRVPVCPLHEGHWDRRAWIGWVGLGALFLALVVGVAAGAGRSTHFWYGFGGCVLGWLTVCALARTTSIRAVRITGTTLFLTGVAGEFADGLQERRKSELQSSARPTARPVELPRKYRVVGITADGREEVVATFDQPGKATECANFLRQGGKFPRVDVVEFDP